MSALCVDEYRAAIENIASSRRAGMRLGRFPESELVTGESVEVGEFPSRKFLYSPKLERQKTDRMEGKSLKLTHYDNFP